MRRRDFITALSAVAVWPISARAQRAGSVPNIGVLMAGAEASPENGPRIAAFRQALKELGWNEGGNVRIDYTFIGVELIGKWMELLRDCSPSLTRASLLFNPATSPAYEAFVREIDASRAPGAVEIAAMPVRSDSEMEAGIRLLGERPNNGLMIGPDPFNQVRIKQIAQLAAQHRVPTVSVYRTFAAAGGLMAYGPDTADVFRRAAAYVDRILKGAKPAELPVQQPDKFEFVINLKVATSLGLQVPPILLARADELIE
jgi:putative ABC transport system substrate-binding protein